MKADRERSSYILFHQVIYKIQGFFMIKKLLMTTIVLGLTFHSAFAKRPEIHVIRYKDDNKALKADTNDVKFHRVIKEIQLSKKKDFAHTSVGGEIRLQYYDIRNLNFGDIRPGALKDEKFLQQRYMLHNDLKISPYFRGFVQITSNHIAGDHTVRPQIDVNRLDLMQLFGEIIIPSRTALSLRLGRQQLSFGKRRMIGFRKTPSVQRSYDGARFSLRKKNIKADLFYILPVSSNEEIFDDYSIADEKVFGTYLTWAKRRQKGIDLYYITALRESAFYVNRYAEDKRHSIGLRGFYRTPSLYLNFESTFQFGSFGDEEIAAYQCDFIGKYQFIQAALKPTIALQANLFSGDKNADDGKNNTFRPIGAAPIGSSPFSSGAANLISLSPEAEISFRKVSLNATFLSIWRYSENDYIYNPSMSRVSRSDRKQITDLFFANSLTGEIEYRLNKHFKFSALAGAVFPQAYAKATGNGEVVKYARLGAQYKF